MKKIICAWLMLLCSLTTVVGAETLVPVLMYHNINETYAKENANVEMSVEEFEAQMKALLNAGYTPISLYSYTDWKNGNFEMPEKPIIITFDDGYLNNYTHVFPLIKKMNIKITIFVITGRMGLSEGVLYPHFTWEQAIEMQNSGLVDIESHTDAHSDFQTADLKTATEELRLSKYLIHKYLNKDAKFLAYPFGNYTEEVKLAAKKAGYTACVQVKTVTPGVNRADTDLYALKRITACGGMSGEELLKTIEANKEW